MTTERDRSSLKRETVLTYVSDFGNVRVSDLVAEIIEQREAEFKTVCAAIFSMGLPMPRFD